MKKPAFSLLLALAVSPMLVQCASQDELNQVNYQLRMLNKKVNDLEASTIDNLQKRQASSSSQMDQLYRDFLQLKSDLEETGHLNRTLKEQNKELENAFKSFTKIQEEKRAAEVERLEQEARDKERQLEAIAQQLKVQQEHVQAIQQARVEEAKRKATAAAKAAEAARAKANAANNSAASSTVEQISPVNQKKVYSAGSAPAETATPAASSAQQAPAQASLPAGNAGSLYEQGKFREAYQAYEKISQSQEGSEAAINARFMMGEALFALKEYDQAILDYQNIITNNPTSPKAPAAMLRQAMAFENLDDKDTAKILYKKLIASYQASPEASQAQQRLAQLN